MADCHLIRSRFREAMWHFSQRFSRAGWGEEWAVFVGSSLGGRVNDRQIPTATMMVDRVRQCRNSRTSVELQLDVGLGPVHISEHLHLWIDVVRNSFRLLAQDAVRLWIFPSSPRLGPVQTSRLLRFVPFKSCAKTTTLTSLVSRWQLLTHEGFMPELLRDMLWRLRSLNC